MTLNLFDDIQRWMNAEMAKAFGVPSQYLASTPSSAREIVAQMRELRAAPPRIVYTTAAVTPTMDRLFPESRHRSARIRKKLIKRFGGMYRMAPAILKTDRAYFVHPSFRQQIEHATRSAA